MVAARAGIPRPAAPVEAASAGRRPWPSPRADARLLDALRHHVDDRADRQVGGLDRAALGVLRPAACRPPRRSRRDPCRAAGRCPAAARSPGSGTGPAPRSGVLRISGRRPSPDSAEPSLRIATASARSSSVPRCRCRYSTRSSSGIRVLAQCTAPAPMPNSARNRPNPSRSSTAAPGRRTPRTAAVSVQLHREVGHDQQQRAQGGQPEQGRHLALGPLGGGRVDVGHPVLVVRQARDCRTGPERRPRRWWRRRARPSAARLGRCRRGCASRRSRCLRSQPDGTADQQAQTDQPGDQALAHRPDRPERQPARGRGVPHALQVGDRRLACSADRSSHR